MRCLRCDSPLEEAAVRCPACCAPLQLPDEPPPPPLDRALDLDRRKSRTPVPASAPPPPTPDQDEGDLGDLSFDAPADDGPWIASPDATGPEGVEPDTDCEGADDAPGEAPSELDVAPRAEWVETEPAFVAARLSTDHPDVAVDAGSEDDAVDEVGEDEPDCVAVQRGKVLSFASLALAGAAALVAVLSCS